MLAGAGLAKKKGRLDVLDRLALVEPQVNPQPSTPQKLLRQYQICDAAKSGDMQEVVRLLDAGFDVNELLDASECFITSATREVMPCVSLTLLSGERLEFPVGGGDVTRQTRDIFADYVEAYISAHAGDTLV